LSEIFQDFRVDATVEVLAPTFEWLAGVVQTFGFAVGTAGLVLAVDLLAVEHLVSEAELAVAGLGQIGLFVTLLLLQGRITSQWGAHHLTTLQTSTFGCWILKTTQLNTLRSLRLCLSLWILVLRILRRLV
jgi:hypothetical protein